MDDGGPQNLTTLLIQAGAEPDAAAVWSEYADREIRAFHYGGVWSKSELQPRIDRKQRAAAAKRFLKAQNQIRRVLNMLRQSPEDNALLQSCASAIQKYGSVAGRIDLEIGGSEAQQEITAEEFSVADAFDTLRTEKFCSRVSLEDFLFMGAAELEAQARQSEARSILQRNARRVIDGLPNDLLTLEIVLGAAGVAFSGRDGRPSSGAKTTFARCIWAWRKATKRWPKAGENDDGDPRAVLHSAILARLADLSAGVDRRDLGTGTKTFRRALAEIKTKEGRRQHLQVRLRRIPKRSAQRR